MTTTSWTQQNGSEMRRDVLPQRSPRADDAKHRRFEVGVFAEFMVQAVDTLLDRAIHHGSMENDRERPKNHVRPSTT
ncbi:hypothetical protein AVO44_19620 [Ruegeria profundi]|uniref:Uncharacterized protein n=2 Tax=Ruegeria profundi TaxID=1685378 RepID=A0A0X3TLL8_9RHOB|nr:hypothetical protein AVO44_19620 [Ruegeria profundi]